MTKCKELHNVAHHLLESHTVSNMASLLGVSRKTIQHWRMSPQRTRKARDKKPGRPFKLTGYLAKRLRRWVNEDPSQALNRLRQHTCTDAGVCVSRPTMSRWLKQLGLARKRARFRNSVCRYHAGMCRYLCKCADVSVYRFNIPVSRPDF